MKWMLTVNQIIQYGNTVQLDPDGLWFGRQFCSYWPLAPSSSWVCSYCETQPPASIGWVALSSVIVVCRLSRIGDTSSHLHNMMFQSIQAIYFLWGYDPGNMSVSTYLLLLSWAQFTVVYFRLCFTLPIAWMTTSSSFSVLPLLSLSSQLWLLKVEGDKVETRQQ